MKFKICWVEYHDFNEDEAKDYLKYLPPKSKITGNLDGLTGFECIDTFEAINIEDLRKQIESYDIPDNIFTVLDEKGNVLFTEEDIDNLELIELCPICHTNLGHFTLNNEDVYGCYKCKKEVERKDSIKLTDLLRKE